MKNKVKVEEKKINLSQNDTAMQINKNMTATGEQSNIS